MRSLVFGFIVLAFPLTLKAQQNSNKIYFCGGENLQNKSAANAPVLYADKCPEFVGGFSRFLDYVSHNFHPLKQINVLPGKMIIQLIIEKDGSVKNAKVLKGNNIEINKEVLKVVKNSPKWIAATFKEKQVRCYFTVPLNIELSDL